MFATHEFSYRAILGAADLEARYATILVVLATTVTICYAFFMITSHRYHLIPHRTSLFPARKPPQATHGTHEPPPDKGVPVDPPSHTCNEHLTLADELDSTSGSEVAADPIVELQASLGESESREVAGHLPPSRSPEARPESETNISGLEGREAEESSEPEPLHADDVVAGLPPTIHPEVELGASSPDTEEKPRVAESQEMVCATSGHMSDGSEDSQHNVESAESLVTLLESSPLVQTRDSEAMDVDASILEAPFLLSADGGTSKSYEAALDAGRSTEDGAIAGSAFVQSSCSQPDSLHDEVPSDIMHSALLVPSSRVSAEDESPLENAVELDAEDDWTSVDPDESSTPRPSSPADLRPALADFAKVTLTEENDLAVSAVLLTQSQYASVMLSSNATDDGDPSPPTSSPPSRGARPRMHTFDRPDWAVAPQEEQEDDATRERTQRRHSLDSPDWAIAPEDTAGGARKKGRKSDPGSGRRKKPRRAWASR